LAQCALFRRALVGYEKALRQEHTGTLATANWLANALNRLNRRQEALFLLRDYAALSAVSGDSVTYNLACYECLEGNNEEAFRLIVGHLAMHPENRALALADDDFAPIHDWIADLA
jgi:lipopolysaccharide biosynthesis regulator YciM